MKTFYVLDLSLFEKSDFLDKCYPIKVDDDVTAAMAAELWTEAVSADLYEITEVLVAEDPDGTINVQKYELRVVEYIEATKVEDE